MVGRYLAKILIIGLFVIFLLSTEATAFKWDFTIEASPVSQTVTAGDGAVFNIKVSAIQSWTTNNNEQTTVDVEFDVPATMTRSLSGPFYLKQSQPTDTRTLTLYTSPDTPPGTYQITLKGTVTSTSTTHSTTISLTVISKEQSKPDLIIQDFYWTPSNPAPGDQVTFTYVEKNQGDGDATGHRVTLYIDNTVISSDNILETLPAGSTRTRTFSDKWTATSGGHDAFVKADSTGGIIEINDENNGLHKTIGTKETVPTTLTINLNPSSISENQKTYLTISGKLRNPNSGSGISNRPIKLEWTGGMTTVTTNSNGDYSYATYVTYSKGTYQFSAKFDSYETSSAVYLLSSSTASLIVGEKSNQPPTAYIDSVSPSSATKGQYVYFSGSGYDPDGSIVGYNWRSSIDGQLSTSRSFSTSSLTQGTHTIYFKVKDDSGTWSSEMTRTLTVSTQNALSVELVSPSNGEAIITLPIEFKVRVTANGNPVKDANVMVYFGNGGSSSSGWIATNSEGYATYTGFSSLASGSTVNWYAEAYKSGYPSGTSPKWGFSYNPSQQQKSDLAQKGINAVEALKKGLKSTSILLDDKLPEGALEPAYCGVDFAIGALPLPKIKEPLKPIVRYRITEFVDKTIDEAGKEAIKFKKFNSAFRDILEPEFDRTISEAEQQRLQQSISNSFMEDIERYYGYVEKRGAQFDLDTQTIINLREQEEAKRNVRDALIVAGEVVIVVSTSGLATPYVIIANSALPAALAGASCVIDVKSDSEYRYQLIELYNGQKNEALEHAENIRKGLRYLATNTQSNENKFPSFKYDTLTVSNKGSSISILNTYNKPIHSKVEFYLIASTPLAPSDWEKLAFINFKGPIIYHEVIKTEENQIAPNEKASFSGMYRSGLTEWLNEIQRLVDTYGTEREILFSGDAYIFYGENGLYAMKKISLPAIGAMKIKPKLQKSEVPVPVTATYQPNVLPPQTAEQPTITSPTPISSPTRIDLTPKIENLKLVAPVIKKDDSDKIQVSYKLSEGFKPFKSENSLLMAGIFKMTIKNKVSIKEKWGLFDLLTRDVVNPVEFTRTIERSGDDVIVKNEDGTSKTVTFNELDNYLRSYDFQIPVKGSDFKSGFFIFEFWEGMHKNVYAEVNTEYSHISSTYLGIPKTGSFSAKSDYVAIEVTGPRAGIMPKKFLVHL